MPAPVAVTAPHATASFQDGWSSDEMPPYGPDQQDDTIEDAPAPAPVVIVEGFLCASSSAVWGGFADEMERGSAARRQASSSSSSSSSSKSSSSASQRPARPRPRPPRQVIFAPIGPVSSLHDRACELFYGLLGGRVDYGEKHAKGCGHARYGRRFERGALPQLFGRRRGGREGGGGGAHFIGHSLGGPTIYKLQQLLRQGFFDEALREGDEDFFVDGRTAADLILSITTISSPLRGTPLVHLMGLEPLPYPVVRRWSLGDCIAKAVHVFAFFDRASKEERGWLRSKMPDTFADAWHFSPRRRGSEGEEEGDDDPWTWRKAFGIAKLWSQLVKSDWAEGSDCAPWDSTMHERMRVEAEDEHWGITDGSSSEKTWYCCVAAYMTERSATAGSFEHDTPRSSSWLTDVLAASPLGLSARLLGKYPFAAMQPLPEIFITSDGDEGADDASRSVEHLVDSGYNSDVDDSSKVRGSSPRRCSLDGQADGLATALPSLAGMLASASPPAPKKKLNAMPSLEAWHANDGVVPLASQYHPRECSQEHCTHHEWPGSEAADRQAGPRTSVVERFFGSVVTPWAAWALRTSGDGGDGRDDGPSKESCEAAPLSTCASVEANLSPSTSPLPSPSLPLPKANHYHTHLIPETTHASLAPLWTASQQQVDFWRFIGGWLESVEEAARA